MADTTPDGQQTDDPGGTLARRVDEAKRRAGLDQIDDPVSTTSNRGMQSGIEFVAAILTCAMIGLGLDRWLETKPLFMLVGLFLGMAVGIWNMYRMSVGANDLSVGIRPKAKPPADKAE